jgi:3-phosphoshikimate 1-carboxyvinyltransferase
MQLEPDCPELRDPLILAALNAVGTCTFTELAPGPDHTERMLRHLGVGVRRNGLNISLKGEQRLYPKRIKVPADFTAAAPFIAAAALLPNSELTIAQVGTNPGRAGLLKTLGRIGGVVERQRTWQFGAEPVASFSVRHNPRLSAFNIAPNLAPSLIDELPLMALIATQAHGTSHLRGAAALRRGVPDSLELSAQILRAFGADVEVEPDGLRLHGPTPLTGAEVQCANEPRLIILAAVAALLADSPSVLHGADAMLDHYPLFFHDLAEVQTG